MTTRDTTGTRSAGRATRLAKRLRIPLLVCLVLLAGFLFMPRFMTDARSQTARPRAGGPQAATPVVAATARKSDVPIQLAGLGSAAPLNSVSVRTRVDGQLMEVLFQEGQPVKRGQHLATIDPRPFEVQLTQAQGQLSRDQALLQNARVDLQRYRDLWDQNSVPKQQLDTQEALVRQYEGTVKIDKGLVDAAKLQLTYCRIIAPIDGRAGLRNVDAGNIVHASDANGLVTITQVQPIAVVFSLPEDNLPQVLARLRRGEKPPVEVYDRESRRRLATGELQTVDNQIDQTTGTVRLKALVPNKEGELFPNQFVNVRLLVDVVRDAVVVPTPAVQRTTLGSLVYVVKEDKTVETRRVELGAVSGGETVVAKGIEPGELVVVDGADRLRQGAQVDVKVQGEAADAKR